jgi:tape measure domain-containing protein
MSSTDRRIVEMQFDNQQFEKNIATSTKSLDGLKKSLLMEGAEKGFSSLEKAAEAITNRFSTMGIAADQMIRRITDSALNAGKQLVMSLSVDQITAGMSKYEQKTASVQSIMNATGKSLKEVNGFLDELMWFSDETSYGFSDMTSALAQMTSSGGDIEKLIPMITGVANATAYAGKGAAEFSGAMFNLNQSYGMGSLQGIDWKSLELRGVGSKQLKQTLIDTGIALGKIKKGQVDIGNFQSTLQGKGKLKGWADREVMEVAFSKFSEMSQEAFELVQAGKYETAAEAIEALSGKYSELAEKAFKSAQTAKTLTEALNATKDAVSSGWLRTFELVFGNFEEASVLWTEVTGILWDTFAAGAEVRNEVLEGWKGAGGRGSMLAAFQNLYNSAISIGAAIRGAFKTVFKPIDAKWLYDLTKRFENFTKNVFDWLNAPGKDGTTSRLVQIGKAFGGFFSILDMGKTIVKGIWDAITGFLNGIGIGSMADSALQFMADLGDKLFELSKTLKTFFGGGKLEGFKLGEMIRNLLNPVKKVSESGGEVQKAKGVLESIGDFFKNLIDKFTAFTSKNKIDWGLLLAGLGVGFVFFKVFQFINTINRFAKVLRNGFESIIDVISTFKIRGDITQAIQNIGIAIASVASAIYLISKVDPNRLLPAILVVGGIIAVLTALAFAFRKIELKDSMKIAAASGALVILGLAINMFAFALLIIGTMDTATMFSAVTTLGLVMLEIAGFLKLVQGLKLGILNASALVLLGVSLNLFAVALRVIGSMDLAGLAKGVVGLGLVMLEIAAFLALTRSIGMSIVDSLALAVIAASMNIFAMSLKTIGGMDTESLIRGVAGLGAVLLEIVVFLGLMKVIQPTPTDFNYLVAIAFAMNEFSKSIRTIGELDTSTIIKGVIGMGLIMLEIIGFLKLVKGSSLKFKEGAALILLATSMNIFAAALAIIGSMDTGSLIKGIVGLGLVLAEIAVFLNLTDKLKFGPIKAIGLILIAISMNAFATALLLIGGMDTTSLVKGVVGLGLVLLEIAAFMALTKKLNLGVLKSASLLVLAVTLNLFAFSIQQLGGMDTSSLVKGILGLGAVMIEISLFMRALDAVKVTSVGKAIVILGVISLALVAFAFVIKSLAGVQPGVMIEFSGSLGIALLSIGGTLALVSKLPLPAILAGIGKLALVIVAIAGVLALIGWLESQIGATASIVKAGELLGAIGSAFGQIIGGFVQGMFKGTSTIGTELSLFMTNLQPFLDGLKKIDSSAIEGVQALVNVITSIAEANVMTAISSFLTGRSSIKKFTEDIAILGEGISEYAKSVSGLDKKAIDNIKSSIEVATGLTGIADALPKSGGLVQLFTGTKDLAKFAKDIPELGKALAAYAKHIKDFDEVKPETSKRAADAAKGISDLANSLPETGGVKQFFTGTKDLARFAKDIPELAVALSIYASNIKTFDNVSLETGKKANETLISLSTFASAIPPTGGVWQFFTGTQDLSTFAEGLTDLGPAIGDYAAFINEYGNVSVGASNRAADTLRSLAYLAGSISGLSATKFWWGNSNLATFADDLEDLGPAIQDYATFTSAYGNISAGASSRAADALRSLATLSNSVGGLAATKYWWGNSNLATFADDLAKLGPAIQKYSEFVASYGSIEAEASDKAAATLTALAALSDSVGGLSATKYWWGSSNLETFSNDLPKLGKAIMQYSKFVKLYGNEEAGPSDRAATTLNSMADLKEKLNGEAVSKFWWGWTDIGAFANDLPELGRGLRAYADFVKDGFPAVDQTNIDNSILAAKGLAGVANELEDKNSWFDKILGISALGTFGDDVGALGDGLAKFVIGASGADSGQSTKAMDTIRAVKTLTDEMDVEGGLFQKIGTFFSGEKSIVPLSSEMANFGTNFKTFTDGVSAAAQALTNVGIVGQIITSLDTLGKNFDNKQFDLTSLLQLAHEFGMGFIGELIAIIRENDASVRKAGSASGEAASEGAKDQAGKFYNAGYSFAQGMANGITSGTFLAEMAAKMLGSKSVEALRKAIDSHSPAKVTQDIGKDYSAGYGVGIGHGKVQVIDAVDDLGSSSLDGLSKIVAKVSGLGTELGKGVSDELSKLELLDAFSPTGRPRYGIGAGSLAAARAAGKAPVTSGEGSKRSAVITTPKLTSYMGTVGLGLSQAQQMASVGNQIDQLGKAIANMKVVMDSGALVGQISAKMDRVLGMAATYSGRGG